MLVTKSNLDQVVEAIYASTHIGFDTETYGLDWDKRMYSMQYAVEEGEYYFNFHDYGDDTYILDVGETLEAMSKVFKAEHLTWFIHNAKFDLHRLGYCGIDVAGRTHDTASMERLINNQYMKYNLDACLYRRPHLKQEKSNEVEAWITKNKAYTMTAQAGKERRQKDKHYDRVPFEIMYRYGIKDAESVRSLGIEQLRELKTNQVEAKLYLNECELTKQLLKMEQRGVLVDTDYAKQGWKYEEEKQQQAVNNLSILGGSTYKSGPKWLASVFDSQGVSYRTNPETNNPVFDKRALGEITHPIVREILEVRRASKYINTYYSDFVHGVDDNNVIHANIRQGGTDTGRFSYSNPNLQNVPKEEDFDQGQIQVRKSIVPRPNHTFVAIDFRQQEFRLMLDYANERRVIKAVMEGEDLHTATAKMVGVTRKQAKTLNFGLLYGMGSSKLAVALNVPEKDAVKIKLQYFNKLPRVENFIADVISKARTRKWIKTWAGRMLRFPNREFAYKAPNHLIQGGCGDIARYSITELADFLQDKPVFMVIQVHDEIIFEVRDDSLEVIPELVRIMKGIYTPINGMYMDCSVETSKVSWGQQDMKEIDYVLVP